MAKRIASIAALLLTVISLGATSAKADAFSITVSQRFGLAAGQTISVQANNLPSDKGIYLVECVLSEGQMSHDPKDCTSPQNVGSALWISNSQGGANPSQAQQFTILRTINSKDCATNECAIVSVRDHVQSSDRSFDSVTKINVSTISFSLEKSTGLVDAGEQFSATITGLPSDKGVYILQCQAPTDDTRPTKCDVPNAVWASNVASALTQGGVDASKAVPFRATGTFVSGSNVVDCQLTACGVYVERDWNGLNDRSLDTFLPISFLAPVQVAQGVTGWKKAPGALKLNLGKSVALANESLKTKQGNSLTWSSNKPNHCKLIQTGNLVKVKAVKAGKCVISATAPATSRTLAKIFTWRIKAAK